mmetsp:Transcript_24158/g.18402  ORF Transcript_24158/g.18402 Transcript_24158/m.18402 type:complete len:181 (+) Transcript_24158:277-819(+)
MQSRKCDFYINLLAMVCILLAEVPGCNIPIRFWLLTYFVIQMGELGYSVMVEKIDDSPYFQQHRKLKIYLKKGTIIALEFFHMAWIIYGNVLYFSANSLCMEQSLFLSWLMFFILVVGYFKLLFYSILILAVLYFCAAERVKKNKSKSLTVNIIKSLKKTKFIKGQELFSEEEECIICWS